MIKLKTYLDENEFAQIVKVVDGNTFLEIEAEADDFQKIIKANENPEAVINDYAKFEITGVVTACNFDAADCGILKIETSTKQAFQFFFDTYVWNKIGNKIVVGDKIKVTADLIWVASALVPYTYELHAKDIQFLERASRNENDD